MPFLNFNRRIDNIQIDLDRRQAGNYETYGTRRFIVETREEVYI